MKQIKVLLLVINSIMLAWMLTEYNIFQGTFISNFFLIGLSMCWIKCYDLIINNESEWIMFNQKELIKIIKARKRKDYKYLFESSLKLNMISHTVKRDSQFYLLL